MAKRSSAASTSRPASAARPTSATRTKTARPPADPQPRRRHRDLPASRSAARSSDALDEAVEERHRCRPRRRRPRPAPDPRRGASRSRSRPWSSDPPARPRRSAPPSVPGSGRVLPRAPGRRGRRRRRSRRSGCGTRSRSAAHPQTKRTMGASPSPAGLGQPLEMRRRQLGPLGDVEPEGDRSRIADRRRPASHAARRRGPPGPRRRSIPSWAPCCRASDTSPPSSPGASSRRGSSGSRSSATATFVSGPSVTSVSSPGRARVASRYRSAASRSLAPRIGLGQPCIPQAGRTVRVGCRSQGPGHGGVAPGRHLDVVASGQRQHRQRVAHDVLQLHVAGHAAHARDLGLLRGSRVEQGQRIVDAGVTVDEQRCWCPMVHHQRRVVARAGWRCAGTAASSPGVGRICGAPCGGGRPADVSAAGERAPWQLA